MVAVVMGLFLVVAVLVVAVVVMVVVVLVVVVVMRVVVLAVPITISVALALVLAIEALERAMVKKLTNKYQSTFRILSNADLFKTHTVQFILASFK